MLPFQSQIAITSSVATETPTRLDSVTKIDIGETVCHPSHPESTASFPPSAPGAVVCVKINKRKQDISSWGPAKCPPQCQNCHIYTLAGTFLPQVQIHWSLVIFPSTREERDQSDSSKRNETRGGEGTWRER